ncbi:MAG: lasso peptide biosynthesis PqqD family chaperone [Chloroflexi bacterium]|nr:lasso peptide biosynthesis PqqD family chaperone [Chloroflexota bacterium]
MTTPNSIDLHTTVVQADGLLASDIDDEVVLLNLETDKYFGMDPVSARIWSLLAQPHLLTTVCNRLLDEFDVDREACEQDVLEFVQKLADAKLVQIAPA